jgi:hypothetical protein
LLSADKRKQVWRNALRALPQGGHNKSQQPNERPDHPWPLPEADETLYEFEYGMIAERVIAEPHLIFTPENTALPKIARFEVIDDYRGQQLGFVAVHARLCARDCVPPAFWDWQKASQTFEAVAAEELDRTRHIAAIKRQMAGCSVHVYHDPSSQPQAGVFGELCQYLLEVRRSEAKVRIK